MEEELLNCAVFYAQVILCDEHHDYLISLLQLFFALNKVELSSLLVRQASFRIDLFTVLIVIC